MVNECHKLVELWKCWGCEEWVVKDGSLGWLPVNEYVTI